jgi:hypothetical protein
VSSSVWLPQFVGQVGLVVGGVSAVLVVVRPASFTLWKFTKRETVRGDAPTLAKTTKVGADPSPPIRAPRPHNLADWRVGCPGDHCWPDMWIATAASATRDCAEPSTSASWPQRLNPSRVASVVFDHPTQTQMERAAERDEATPALLRGPGSLRALSVVRPVGEPHPLRVRREDPGGATYQFYTRAASVPQVTRGGLLQNVGRTPPVPSTHPSGSGRPTLATTGPLTGQSSVQSKRATRGCGWPGAACCRRRPSNGPDRR